MVSFNSFTVTGLLFFSIATVSIAQSDPVEPDPVTDFAPAMTSIPDPSDYSLDISDLEFLFPTSVLDSGVSSINLLGTASPQPVEAATTGSAATFALGAGVSSTTIALSSTPATAFANSSLQTQTLAIPSGLQTVTSGTPISSPVETSSGSKAAADTLTTSKTTNAVASAKPSASKTPSLFNQAEKFACSSVLGLAVAVVVFFFGY